MDIKPKRRWLRYSLRTLLAFVTIACVGFGWLGVKVRAKQNEREAVKVIREKGGHVIYDYQIDQDRRLIASPTPPGPAWFKKLLGDDFFAVVISATYAPEATDADLQHLPALSQLKGLCLSETQVTDAGVAQIKTLRQLKNLIISRSKVTDAGINELRNALPNTDIVGRGTDDARD